MTYSLEEMADRMAINDLITYYVHAIDAGNYDDLDNVFLPDTIFDLTSAGAIKGPWTEVKEYYRANRVVYEHYFHMYGNLLITFDADRASARVKSKVLNPIGIRDDKGKLRIFQVDGSYDDIFVKMPAGWRIKERIWIHGDVMGDYPFENSIGSMQKARKMQSADD
jgi:hypothetical protein